VKPIGPVGGTDQTGDVFVQIIRRTMFSVFVHQPFSLMIGGGARGEGDTPWHGVFGSYLLQRFS
jgi:hypothetical protein